LVLKMSEELVLAGVAVVAKVIKKNVLIRRRNTKRKAINVKREGKYFVTRT
jgi:hypothetical protein